MVKFTSITLGNSTSAKQKLYVLLLEYDVCWQKLAKLLNEFKRLNLRYNRWWSFETITTVVLFNIFLPTDRYLQTVHFKERVYDNLG